MKTLSFLLLAFFATAPAFAGLRGDWQSAGSPMPPYDPPYKFLYRCQAELTDYVERTNEQGRPYRLYAVQKFEASQEKAYTDLSGNWVWIAKMLDAPDRDSAEVELKKAPKDAFSLKGHGSGLRLQRGPSVNEDRVTLSASVKLSLGDYFLSGHDNETTIREASSLSVRAHASLFREEGRGENEPKMKERSLFVVCDKIK
jgi:hypothetical protein